MPVSFCTRSRKLEGSAFNTVVGTRRDARQRRFATLLVVAPTECDELVTRLEIAVTSTDSALQAAVGAAKPGEARLLVRVAAISDEEDFVHG